MILIILLSPVLFLFLIIDLLFWIFITPFFLLRSIVKNEFANKFLYNLFITYDQTANVFMFGDPDETISGRFGRRWPDSWFRKLLDKILGPGHCQQAIESDEGKDDLIK